MVYNEVITRLIIFEYILIVTNIFIQNNKEYEMYQNYKMLSSLIYFKEEDFYKRDFQF